MVWAKIATLYFIARNDREKPRSYANGKKNIWVSVQAIFLFC